MAWAAIPGALKAYLGVSEAIVSLFLNYIAISLLQYLVHGPLRDPASLGWPMSPQLPPSLLLSSMSGTRLHSGIIVALLLTALLIGFLRVTRRGAELRAVGLSPQTSSMVKIPVSTYLFGSMVVGGALAGLAGYYEIAATQHRLRVDISSGFGYSGFLVAWICRKQLLLIIPIAILVAGLSVSSESLQITNGLPAASADVVQGFLLLFVLLGRSLLSTFERWRAINLAMEKG
jgi:simple sugar transport system permease protein